MELKAPGSTSPCARLIVVAEKESPVTACWCCGSVYGLWGSWNTQTCSSEGFREQSGWAFLATGVLRMGGTPTAPTAGSFSLGVNTNSTGCWKLSSQKRLRLLPFCSRYHLCRSPERIPVAKRGCLLWLLITFPCSQAAICPCSWLIPLQPEPVLWGIQTLSGIQQPRCCFQGCTSAARLPALRIEGIVCIFFPFQSFTSCSLCRSLWPGVSLQLPSSTPSSANNTNLRIFFILSHKAFLCLLCSLLCLEKICSSHLHPHLIEISAKNSLLLWNPGKMRGRTGNRNQKRISQPCPCISSSNTRLCLSRSLHDLSVVTFIFPFPSPSVFGPPSLVHAEYKLHSSAETLYFSMYFEQCSTFFFF